MEGSAIVGWFVSAIFVDAKKKLTPLTRRPMSNLDRHVRGHVRFGGRKARAFAKGAKAGQGLLWAISFARWKLELKKNNPLLLFMSHGSWYPQKKGGKRTHSFMHAFPECNVRARTCVRSRVPTLAFLSTLYICILYIQDESA